MFYLSALHADLHKSRYQYTMIEVILCLQAKEKRFLECFTIKSLTHTYVFDASFFPGIRQSIHSYINHMFCVSLGTFYLNLFSVYSAVSLPVPRTPRVKRQDMNEFSRTRQNEHFVSYL